MCHSKLLGIAFGQSDIDGAAWRERLRRSGRVGGLSSLPFNFFSLVCCVMLVQCAPAMNRFYILIASSSYSKAMRRDEIETFTGAGWSALCLKGKGRTREEEFVLEWIYC